MDDLARRSVGPLRVRRILVDARKVVVWLVFAAMLFVIEPLFLHRRMAQSPRPASDFARMERFHWIVLILALVTVVGAALGSPGLF